MIDLWPHIEKLKQNLRNVRNYLLSQQVENQQNKEYKHILELGYVSMAYTTSSKILVNWISV